MTPISETLRDLLVRQGLANGRSAIRPVHAKKEPGAAIEGAHRQLVADSPEGGSSYPPTAGGGDQPMGISGKGRGTVKAPPVDQEVGSVSTHKPSPANGRPVPQIVVDNGRCLGTATPTRLPRAAVSKHLKLVWSQ